jgi:hypothetical protein
MTRSVERDTIVKQGDSKALWLEASGDLSTTTTLEWQARRRPGAAPLLTAPANFISYTDRVSVVRVDLDPPVTDNLGLWLYELVAQIGGDEYHFPDDGYLRLRVIEHLG